VNTPGPARKGYFHAGQPYVGDPSAAGLRSSEPPQPGRVVGLGVTDALRVALEPCQLDACLAELDEIRQLRDQTLVEAWQQGEPAQGEPAHDEQLDRARYDVNVVAAVSRHLVKTAPAPVLCGPASLVSEVVVGATHDVAEAFAGLLVTEPQLHAQAAGRLLAGLETLDAWVRTYVDCRAVENFSFDADTDHSRER
jgi:hypothetical protein